MLRVRDLRIPGMHPVTLDLPRGGCLAIQGPSGSGKTRMLRAIADLDPNTGEISLDGDARTAVSAPVWRRRVVYLATDAGWWLDHVGSHFAHWAQIADALTPLGLPEDCRTSPVSRLSTGERQRLALLRALAVAPEVLLLDEPTSALDETATSAVEALIAERRENGLAVVWVTHDRDQARRVGDEVRAIRNGALTAA